MEKSLSADNLFALVVIMSSFGVPREHQQRVLIFGIAASLCLRAAFIALGAALLELLWSGTGQACRRTGRSW